MKKLFTFVCALAMAVCANAYESVSTAFGAWDESCVVDGNTLTFNKDWAGAGVGFTTGDEDNKKCTDMSEYDYLWLTFSETTCDFNLNTQYTTSYKYDVSVSCVAGTLCAGVKLNEDHADEFAQYYIQCKGAGKVVVTGAYVGTEEEYQKFLDANKVQKSDVALTGWGKWDSAIEITEESDGTMTVAYPAAWAGASMWFGAKDLSEFDYCVLELVEPVEFRTQLWLQYNETKDGSNSVEAFIESGETSVKLELDERKKAVDQIAIQTSDAGTIKVKAIYFCTKDYVPTGISNVSAVESVKAGKAYNLSGMEVDDSYKGIVIQNGKKFVRK